MLTKPGPYLILPNHPAYIDPPNVLAHLWPTFRMRPMLLETNFENPFLAPFAWLLRGDPRAGHRPGQRRGPAADRGRRRHRHRRPEGRRQRHPLADRHAVRATGPSYLGAARTAADVLAAVPNATVVLVRTRGLWGSSFSWA